MFSTSSKIWTGWIIKVDPGRAHKQAHRTVQSMKWTGEELTPFRIGEAAGKVNYSLQTLRGLHFLERFIVNTQNSTTHERDKLALVA